MNNTVKTSELPVIADLTNAKVIGLDQNNVDAAFPLSALNINNLGELKITDPTPPTPLTGQGYDLIGTGPGTSPSGTYPNLPGVGGAAIVIPAPAAGNGIFEASVKWYGSFWHPHWQEKTLPLKEVSGLVFRGDIIHIDRVNSKIVLPPNIYYTRAGVSAVTKAATAYGTGDGTAWTFPLQQSTSIVDTLIFDPTLMERTPSVNPFYIETGGTVNTINTRAIIVLQMTGGIVTTHFDFRDDGLLFGKPAKGFAWYNQTVCPITVDFTTLTVTVASARLFIYDENQDVMFDTGSTALAAYTTAFVKPTTTSTNDPWFLCFDKRDSKIYCIHNSSLVSNYSAAIRTQIIVLGQGALNNAQKNFITKGWVIINGIELYPNAVPFVGNVFTKVAKGYGFYNSVACPLSVDFTNSVVNFTAARMFIYDDNQDLMFDSGGTNIPTYSTTFIKPASPSSNDIWFLCFDKRDNKVYCVHNSLLLSTYVGAVKLQIVIIGQGAINNPQKNFLAAGWVIIAGIELYPNGAPASGSVNWAKLSKGFTYFAPTVCPITVDIASATVIASVTHRIFLHDDAQDTFYDTNNISPYTTAFIKPGSYGANNLWYVCFDRRDNKMYCVHYTLLASTYVGAVRASIDIIGMGALDIPQKNFISTGWINISGVELLPNSVPSSVATNELIVPPKIFMLTGEKLPIYKSSMVRSTAEMANDVVIASLSTGSTDFGFPVFQSVREYHLLDPASIKPTIRIYSQNPNDTTKQYGVDVVVSQVAPNAKTGLTKKWWCWGDSLTNRGVANFTKFYLSAISSGLTLNNYGTMTNSTVLGEGREGWTWLNFIGADNTHLGDNTVITLLGAGATTSTLYQNPFLRLAVSADYTAHPTWCFRNTGSNAELSYATDTDKTGNFYIFDPAYYLAQHTPGNTPDVITIALSTNDITENLAAGVTNSLFGLTVVLTQLKTAFPSVKIGIIPATTQGDNSTKWSFICDWINQLNQTLATLALSNIDIVGVWLHMNRHFIYPYLSNANLRTDGNLTQAYTLSENIHFGQDGYLPYAKALGAYLINIL